MKHCIHCDIATEQSSCPRCGARTIVQPADSMDQLIQQASIPNLATLFKRAKQTGAIGSVSAYGEGTPA